MSKLTTTTTHYDGQRCGGSWYPVQRCRRRLPQSSQPSPSSCSRRRLLSE